MVVAFIYSLYNPDLYWPGLILMFIMYGVIYFIGARAAASKKENQMICLLREDLCRYGFQCSQ